MESTGMEWKINFGKNERNRPLQRLFLSFSSFFFLPINFFKKKIPNPKSVWTSKVKNSVFFFFLVFLFSVLPKMSNSENQNIIAETVNLVANSAFFATLGALISFVFLCKVSFFFSQIVLITFLTNLSSNISNLFSNFHKNTHG